MAKRSRGQPMFELLQEAQALERSGKHILHFELGIQILIHQKI